MPWESKYVPDTATVVVNGSGRLCLNDVKRTSGEAARLLQENKARRVLLDCSDADLDVKTVDVFYLPKCYDKVGMPRNARIALILPKTRQPSGLYEFYETVCRNQGYMCRLFNSQRPAEQWLGSEGPTPLPNHIPGVGQGV